VRIPESGPNVTAVGEVAAENLAPLLYALEVCAVAMDQAERGEDAGFYRALAAKLAAAGGGGPEGGGSAPPGG
jgi:hypothetical protein